MSNGIQAFELWVFAMAVDVQVSHWRRPPCGLERSKQIDDLMKATKDFFGSLEDRHVYQEEDHTVFLDMFGIVLNSQDDIGTYP